jgi:hypothetical protein
VLWLCCAGGAFVVAPRPATAQGAIEVTVSTAGGAPGSGTATATGSGRSASCRVVAGRCVIASLPPGSYTVTVVAPGSAPVRRPVTVVRGTVAVQFVVSSSPDGASRSPVDAVAARGGRDLGSGSRLAIQGTATYERGTPVAGTVEVRRGGQGIGRVRVTSGRFVVYDLDPGTYELTFTPDGQAPQRRAVSVGGAPVVVSFVVHGADPGLSLNLQAQHPAHGAGGRDLSVGSRLVIQGTATTMRGTPAAGVVEVRAGGALVGTARVVTGRFAVYDLAPGSYRLTLRPVTGEPVERNAMVGAVPVTVAFVVR